MNTVKLFASLAFGATICLALSCSAERQRDEASVARVSLAAEGLCQTATLTRESVSSAGIQGNGRSSVVALSADGRFLAYQSAANNLVSGDNNGVQDIFLRDRLATTTARVSVTSNQGEAHGPSYNPTLSADGTKVAFMSAAADLVSQPLLAAYNAFVHDVTTGRTELVSLATSGSVADGSADGVLISADGSTVIWTSVAGNLVPGDTNGLRDVFYRDLQGQTTGIGSRTSSGAQSNDSSVGNAVSGNGRYIAFTSTADNLTPGDTNGVSDVFRYDRVTSSTRRMSVSATGGQASGSNGGSRNAALSDDGQIIAFQSFAENLVGGDTNGYEDIFVYEPNRNLTERVSVGPQGAQGDGRSYSPSMSGDGRYVVFLSNATNLVTGDTNQVADVFVRDRVQRSTRRLSASQKGAQADAASFGPAVSADGRVVGFDSFATNLVAGDTNATLDVFVAAGPARPPAWTVGVAYQISDLVSYANGVYRVVQAHTAQVGWEPDRTPALFTVPGCDGGSWAPQTEYSAGMEVTHAGKRYRCRVSHTSVVGWEPPLTPTLWEPR